MNYATKTSTEEYKRGENYKLHAGLTRIYVPKTKEPQSTITTVDIIKFDQLSVNPKLPVNSKLLYVDALNYGSKFFGRGGDHWSILDGVEKIKKFIKAAENSGWQLKVFIDAAAKTNEAMKKWRKRREEEVTKECRDIPQGMNTLLGDAFQENGIEVLYSVEADNDDTLAAYASRDNASILSGDRDFFRYIGLASIIYKEFKVKKGRLHLVEQIENDKYVSKRRIISPPPKVMDKDPSLVELSDHIYRRGVPSSLVKRIGNIHITCRSLRQALYSRKGVTNPVLEIFPIWENNRAAWLQEHVLPDNKLDHLLDNPNEAIEIFFPKESLLKPDEISDKEWKNHLYAIHAVVYELCALGSKNRISLLQMLRPAVVKFQGDSKSSQPAYETVCIGCKISIRLYEKDVLFYQSKGFSMPKRCKECKQAKGESANKKQFGYYGYYY